LLDVGVQRCTAPTAIAGRLRPADASRAARDDVEQALTRRDLEAFEHLATAVSNTEIAAELVLSAETVKTYVCRILTKRHLRDRVQAVVLARRICLVSTSD
jgi:DNA-binding NarL/FixJ family response regulator